MRLPDFSLTASDGSIHCRADYRGQLLVVYFYPKDNTPGCSTEAAAFQAALPKFKRLKVALLGVSPDSLASHCRFRDRFSLTFPLLSDEGHGFALSLGVWAEKQLYGRSFMGIVRSTFLVGADGAIVEEWRKVKVNGHVEAVLERCRVLARGGSA
jgi:peroxiredoxin Q/BCP